jgi:uncharacterized 2Fe-2S/4Fe-4S cluster protein (DUF4445 family)
MTPKHTVVLQPSGTRGEVAEGTNLRAAIRGLGVDIESVCAENATCGKCKVLLEEGTFAQYGITSRSAHLSEPNAEETQYFADRGDVLAGRGWKIGQVRLACQARILGDVVITVPEESLAHRQIVRKSARDRLIEIRPAVRKYLVELNPPTLANPKADWERLASGLATSIELARYGEPNLPRAADLSIDYACLRTLPDALRDSNWRMTVSVWNDREVVRIEPGYNDALYGAAVDIGTTTVALYLCDLTTGEILAAESDMNPQIPYGEDVMSRIQTSRADPDGLPNLHKAIIRSLNQLLTRAAKSAGIGNDDIMEMAVVGNTTMTHLFLNVSPRHLGVAPFTPAICRSIDIKARELRLAVNKSANVFVLPAIAAFIGADTTGVLLAEEPYEQDETWLIIDIGTNAELVLGNRQRLVCASTPTGPAFEGAHIEFGMRAAAGAIEHLEIDPKTLKPRWKIIGEDGWGIGKPMGLCGSAVVDAVAGLLRAGALDSSGRLVPSTSSPERIRRSNRGREYVIAFADESGLGADICLTQKDVRQIQLAKAALFVAAESIAREFGPGQPDKILLAGAFGSYLDKANAMAIGMLPEVPLQRVFVVGNSAGDGARIALLNTAKRHEASGVAGRLTRYELPTDPEFQARFLKAMSFPTISARSER